MIFWATQLCSNNWHHQSFILLIPGNILSVLPNVCIVFCATGDLITDLQQLYTKHEVLAHTQSVSLIYYLALMYSTAHLRFSGSIFWRRMACMSSSRPNFHHWNVIMEKYLYIVSLATHTWTKWFLVLDTQMM